MANLVAGDVTVTFNSKRRNNGRNYFNVTLAFGDGAKTYPAGGVPLTIASLGCPNIVESCDIYDQGLSGYAWAYDTTNKKLTAVGPGGHGHAIYLKNADQTDGATTRVNAAASKLGTNTGSDVTVAASDGSTAGGITNSAASSTFGQASAVAVAATTLKCEIIGW